MLVSLAVLLLGGAATVSAVDDYPIVDALIPVFGAEAAASYWDETPMVQDAIAAPWEPVTPVTRVYVPRCCDGIAVPDGW